MWLTDNRVGAEAGGSMRRIAVFLAGAVLAASPAYAADELKFGAFPSWVAPQPIPQKATNAAEAPVAVLLNDTQIRLEPGKITQFTELAIKLQTPDGLSAGNIAFPWQPSLDTVTVNKLHILRDGKVIDVLKSGQTFTVARRETNMEAATLDGTLTANIQPEGLQVGDIINLAVTTERVDPVMKGHVESTYALWNGVTVEKGHVRISWPTGLKLFTRQTENLPQPKQSTHDGWNSLELSARDLEPLLLPKAAPMRFRVGRAGEASDFKSWSQVADLMAPLYKEAAVVPKAGPLRDEVEKIRRESKSEIERAEKALQLVEDRVRYVALLMGLGGYVPASAEATWSRRFGDCKAKTALLVALLHELGVEAEPVAVHSTSGDMLPQRLPMVGYFDHVIVRARIGGTTYWLDGTRTGDVRLDRIPVPAFKWALPLQAGATLVPILQLPLDEPDIETRVVVDATNGIFAPAPFNVERTFRGDSARTLNLVYSRMSANQHQEALREYWREIYDYVTVASTKSVYDRDRAEIRFSMSGTAKLPWEDGWWYIPESTIAFNPDFSRAAGKFHDAPFAIDFPSYDKTQIVVRLPKGFAGQTLPPPVRETRAGVEYVRAAALREGALTIEASERSVVPEVPYKDALAAKARLKALYDDDVHLRVPAGYKPSEADVAAQAAETPASAQEFVNKGAILASAEQFDAAIAAFGEALKLDSRNLKALGARASTYAAKQDFESAERDLAALEKLDPGNSDTARLRGFVHYSKEDLDKADEAFSQVLRDEPGDAYASLQRGLIRLDQDRPEEAIADFDAALASSPTNAEALAKRASAYYSLGNYDKAFADSEAAVKSGAPSAELRLLRANILRRQGKPDLVVTEAELLMSEHPKSDYALVAAGKIFSAAGRRDKAIAAFDRALAVTREAYVYINRSQVRAPDDHAGQMSDLDEALKLEPDSADALALKVRLLLRLRRFQEAVQLLDRSLAADPDAPLDLRRRRAVALHKSGRIDESEKAFAEVRSRSEKAVDFNNLCWDKATANIMLESAIEDCRKALELRPETPSYLDSLGMALLRLGKLDEAADAYGRALAKTRLAPSLMGRAIIHARKGDLERAKADRAEALKLNPDIELEFADYGLDFPDAQKKLVSQ